MYLGHICVYNLNKETQQTNTQTCGGEGGGGGKTLFFFLNPRYLVFVLEVSMQKGDLQEKSKSRCRGKFGTTYYLTTTYFRYIKKLQVGILRYGRVLRHFMALFFSFLLDNK